MISALVGHLVGDYLFQNDWMQQKKQKSWICAVHCLIWSICVWIFTFIESGIFWPLWTLPILFITHFIQDRTTIINKYMSIIGQHKFSKPPCAPWSIFVVDNVFHILTIWIIWIII